MMKAGHEQVGILQCRGGFVNANACWVIVDRHWQKKQYSSSGMSASLCDHVSLAQHQQGRLLNLSTYKVAEHMQ